jgi:hypothetical protein
MAKAKGRPKKPGGLGTQVRIDSDIASMAKYLAAQRGESITEYLSAMLRPQVVREFQRAAKDVVKGEGAE